MENDNKNIGVDVVYIGSKYVIIMISLDQTCEGKWNNNHLLCNMEFIEPFCFVDDNKGL